MQRPPRLRRQAVTVLPPEEREGPDRQEGEAYRPIGREAQEPLLGPRQGRCDGLDGPAQKGHQGEAQGEGKDRFGRDAEGAALSQRLLAADAQPFRQERDLAEGNKQESKQHRRAECAARIQDELGPQRGGKRNSCEPGECGANKA